MRGETAVAENLRREKMLQHSRRTDNSCSMSMVWAIDELGFLLIFVCSSFSSAGLSFPFVYLLSSNKAQRCLSHINLPPTPNIDN
jgi:hypothetical protein